MFKLSVWLFNLLLDLSVLAIKLKINNSPICTGNVYQPMFIKGFHHTFIVWNKSKDLNV